MQPSTRGIARIVLQSPDGGERHVGMALVVDERHVLTCAHVVNDALGRTSVRDPARPPADHTFAVRFPYADNALRAAGVVKWGFAEVPPRDVAVLELTEAAPAAAGVAAFTTADVRGKPWACVGCDKHGQPREVRGVFGAVMPRDGLQLNGTDGVAPRIEGGYSGGGAWADGPDALAGMVVELDGQTHRTGIAYAIPTADLAKVWPALLDRRGRPAGGRVVLGDAYTLMEVRGLVGRRDELDLLNEWVAGQGRFHGVPVFVLTAIGGMGKSAVLWHWLRHEAPEMAGYGWWSFYDNPSFDQFVAHALHWTTGRPLDDALRLFPKQRTEAHNELLRALEAKPFLLALDGLERLLVAYAAPDALHTTHAELEAANREPRAGKSLLPTATRENTRRRCIVPAAGALLRRLTTLTTSRVVVSTRLFPTDLEDVTGNTRGGVFEHELRGLSDDDAVRFWRAYGLTGSREELLALFHTFGNHPLLIKVLAGEVAHDRRAGKSFAAWRAARPAFDPFSLPIAQSQTHILEFALQGLNAEERATIETVSAFRYPVGYDALSALLVRDGGSFRVEPQLNAVLDVLEDRGLLGWDRERNLYDMHPVVRGVVWSLQDGVARAERDELLFTYFDKAEEGRTELETVSSIEELAVPIEKVGILLRMGRYDDAARLWEDRLENPFTHEICYARQHAGLLERFFPGGELTTNHFRDSKMVRHALGTAYMRSARPALALPLRTIRAAECDCEACRSNVAYIQGIQGRLSVTERAYRYQANRRYRLSMLTELLQLWLTRGVAGLEIAGLEAMIAGTGVVGEWKERVPSRGANTGRYAAWFQWLRSKVRIAIRSHDLDAALELTARLRSGATVQNDQMDLITLALLEGDVRRACGELDAAVERTDWALTEARRTEDELNELDALVARAVLDVQLGEYESADTHLGDAWLRLTDGPFAQGLSRGCLLKSKIEGAAGRLAEAREYATEAVRHAWGDGPPFAFHDELEAARAECKRLGVPVPQLPPYSGGEMPELLPWKPRGK